MNQRLLSLRSYFDRRYSVSRSRTRMYYKERVVEEGENESLHDLYKRAFCEHLDSLTEQELREITSFGRIVLGE